MTYLDKLKDPRWQKLRLEIFQRDEFSCQSCGNDEVELQVHHKRYLKGKDPWDYPHNLLTTLCKTCHSTETADGLSAIIELNDLLREKFTSWDIRRLTKAFKSLPEMNFVGRFSFTRKLVILFRQENLEAITDAANKVELSEPKINTDEVQYFN